MNPGIPATPPKFARFGKTTGRSASLTPNQRANPPAYWSTAIVGILELLALALEFLHRAVAGGCLDQLLLGAWLAVGLVLNWVVQNL